MRPPRASDRHRWRRSVGQARVAYNAYMDRASSTWIIRVLVLSMLTFLCGSGFEHVADTECYFGESADRGRNKNGKRCLGFSGLILIILAGVAERRSSRGSGFWRLDVQVLILERDGVCYMEHGGTLSPGRKSEGGALDAYAFGVRFDCGREERGLQ